MLSLVAGDPVSGDDRHLHDEEHHRLRHETRPQTAWPWDASPGVPAFTEVAALLDSGEIRARRAASGAYAAGAEPVLPTPASRRV